MRNQSFHPGVLTRAAMPWLLIFAVIAACHPCFGASPSLAPKIIMSYETTSDDAQRPAEFLRAGPVRLKFADGELRYLRVGDKEIIRRIYFAVRAGNWDTAM